MTWTLSLLLMLLWPMGEPSALDDELALVGRGQGRMTEVLVANAALKARLFAWLATVEQAMGDEKAAAKAREVASDALELALTDREFAQHFLGDARDRLRRSRGRPTALPALPDSGDREGEGGAQLELDGSLEQQRADLRAARSPR
jgi:hypothetical protein